MTVRLIQVIETDLEHHGCGHPECGLANGEYGHGEIFRRVTQYWSTEGTLLAEVDPCEAQLRQSRLKEIAEAIMGPLNAFRPERLKDNEMIRAIETAVERLLAVR